MIAVIPWFLSNVISGSPRVLEPYISSARYAAEFRNFFWQHKRVTKGDPTIRMAPAARPYPTKSDQISDYALDDSGKNFGRIARTSLMDEYVGLVNQELISGIEARYWLQFFKMFQEHDDPAKIAAVFKRLQKQVAASYRDGTEGFAIAVLDAVRREFGIE